MNPPLHYLQWSVWGLALTFFLMMTWVSGKFFKANDPGAIRGRRIMAALAGGNAIFALWTLFPPTLATAIQLIPTSLLFMYAIGMFIWAWQTNRARPLNFVFSDQVPQHINQSGPYRLVRHPFYSAYCAAWLGTALASASNNWLLPATCFALVLIYAWAARQEELAFYASPLGECYAIYITKTRMLVPTSQHYSLWQHNPSKGERK